MDRTTYLLLTGWLIPGFVIILFGHQPVAAQTVNVTDATRVISGDDLRNSGVARLSDLLLDVAEARVLTLDGFTTRFSLGGIGSFSEAAPLVFIDGHPIEFGFLASGDLSLVGLSIEVIDRVEFYARPSLISGVFAGQGAIHIFTKQSDKNPQMYGGVLVGLTDAEAGRLDLPGGARTSNELHGPDAEVAGLGRVAGGTVLAAAVHRRHAHAERPGEADRPLTTTMSPSAIYSWTDQRVHLSVLGVGVSADRFAYAPYASRVFAMGHKGATISTMAAHRIGDRSFLRHRATIDLSNMRSPRDAALWKERAFSWMSALARTFDERIVVLGGTAEVRRGEFGGVVEDVRWGSAFAAIAGRMALKTQYRGGGAVAMDGRSVAVRAYGGITFARWEKHRIDVYAAIVDALLHEQNDADLWAREGLPPPLFPADVHRPSGDIAVRATFDAEWRWQADALQEVRIGAGIRRSEKTYLSTRSLLPAAGGGLHESIEFGYTSGTLGVLWGEFVTHVLPGRQRVFWNWQRAIAGRDAYEAAWSATPDARVGASITTPMFGGFRLQGIVIRQSGSKWQEFNLVPSVASDVSGTTRVDVILTKRLLSGRLNASVGVQNALAHTIQYHPLGDIFGRSVRFEARFDLVRRR